jgi:hypothetical protein
LEKKIVKHGNVYTGSFNYRKCGPYERVMLDEQIPEIYRKILDERGKLEKNDFKYLRIFGCFVQGWG